MAGPPALPDPLAPSGAPSGPTGLAASSDLPPAAAPQAATRAGAWRVIAASALAGGAVGAGEWLVARTGGATGPVHGTGWWSGLALVLAADLAAAVLLGLLLALLLRAWQAVLPGAVEMLRPAALLAARHREPGSRSSRHGALLLGGAAALALALAACWPLLVRLPEQVHSPHFRAAAALLLVLAALLAAGLLTPLFAWPLRRVLARAGLGLAPVGAGLAGLGLLGLAAAAWGLRDVLRFLPLGWLVPLLGYPVTLVAGLLLLRRRGGCPGRASAPIAAPALLLIACLAGCLALGELSPARRVAFRGTRLAAVLLDGLRGATDFDGDGASSLFGGGDCRPFDPHVHPGAVERPGNGLDDDCRGGDAPQPAADAARAGRTSRKAPGALTPWPSGTERPKSLLLISVDALRADHVGAYGYPRPTTPALDAFARDAVLVERFYSPSPCTRWALPMMQVSRCPSVMRWDRRPWPHAVEASEATLAEMLRRERFVTAAVWVFRSTFGLDQGFVHWQRVSARSRAPEVAQAAAGLLERLAGKPFYLWVHFYDPHHPYLAHGQPDLPRFGRRPVDLYDEEIALVDREVGRLLARVDALGLRDSTLVAITADHGEEFGEHGGQAHWGNLYEEVIRIPLLLRGPGLTPRRLPGPASLSDLAPTFLDLLGVARRRPGAALAGESLVPLLLGDGPAEPRPAFSTLTFFPRDSQRSRAVMLGRDKLIYDPRSGLLELYDLLEDPGERRDLSEAEPERAQRLLGLLLPWMAKCSPEVLTDGE